MSRPHWKLYLMSPGLYPYGFPAYASFIVSFWFMVISRRQLAPMHLQFSHTFLVKSRVSSFSIFFFCIRTQHQTAAKKWLLFFIVLSTMQFFIMGMLRLYGCRYLAISDRLVVQKKVHQTHRS